MPPPPPPPQAAPPALTKPYFFYGHRKPTQNRPTVRGGFFSNHRTVNPNKSSHPPSAAQQPFDLQKWDPDQKINRNAPYAKDPSEKFFSLAKNLSPIARYIVDAFRKHKQWTPPLVAELNRLRRVTPKLVAEILKFPDVDPRLSTKFFHWAGARVDAFARELPTEMQFAILIRMHADATRGLRVHYVYEKMKKFGVKPRVFLYNRIMDALVKTGHLDLAISVYDDFVDGIPQAWRGKVYPTRVGGFVLATTCTDT
ncbi:hypothetical protein BUALT_Bualt19G0046100 [Buddleja alternifolia]|uniref:Pentatricopeptide repeat-containing protein n=1 Tax=Buddleja alternifolia TaxID=168488 RepID=A0AAV6W515_9LAMI|nr:hypothetical protein BUALT_Bualt19G0046100 [Buddleja alternifolia]